MNDAYATVAGQRDGTEDQVQTLLSSALRLQHLTLSAVTVSEQQESPLCALVGTLQSLRLHSVRGSLGKLLVAALESQSLAHACFCHISAKTREFAPTNPHASNLRVLSLRRVAVFGLWRASSSPLPSFPRMESFSAIGCSNIVNRWFTQAVESMRLLQELTFEGVSAEVADSVNLYIPALHRLDHYSLVAK